MNCSEAQELLSAFYDGELSADLKISVRTHVEECSECAHELAVFQKLSALTKELDSPQPPSESWQSLEKQLEARPRFGKSLWSYFGESVSAGRLAAAAAVVVVFVGIAAYVLWNSFGQSEHHGAISFSDYLEAFDKSPAHAQEILIQTYQGRKVTLPQAEEKLRYRPVVAKGLPAGYRFKSLYLLDMPCCTCPQAVYERDDGSVLTVFEYDAEQPATFGSRPCICANCKGIATTIIQGKERLTVTFRTGKRYVTIIGVQDMEEVPHLVAQLGS